MSGSPGAGRVLRARRAPKRRQPRHQNRAGAPLRRGSFARPVGSALLDERRLALPSRPCASAQGSRSASQGRRSPAPAHVGGGSNLIAFCVAPDSRDDLDTTRSIQPAVFCIPDAGRHRVIDQSDALRPRAHPPARAGDAISASLRAPIRCRITDSTCAGNTDLHFRQAECRIVGRDRHVATWKAAHAAGQQGR